MAITGPSLRAHVDEALAIHMGPTLAEEPDRGPYNLEAMEAAIHKMMPALKKFGFKGMKKKGATYNFVVDLPHPGAQLTLTMSPPMRPKKTPFEFHVSISGGNFSPDDRVKILKEYTAEIAANVLHPSGFKFTPRNHNGGQFESKSESANRTILESDDVALMRKYVHAQHALSGALSTMTSVIKEFRNDKALDIWRKAKAGVDGMGLEALEAALGLSESTKEDDDLPGHHFTVRAGDSVTVIDKKGYKIKMRVMSTGHKDSFTVAPIGGLRESTQIRENDANAEHDAKEILKLFKKHFKYVRVRGQGSSSHVIFSFEIENGLFSPGLVVPFANAFGVKEKDVTLESTQIRESANSTLDGIFKNKQSSKKSDSLRGALQSEILTTGSLSPEEEKAVAALPVVVGKGEFNDDVDSHGHQYYIFKYGTSAFLADNQGYKYPRYVLVIDRHLLRQLRK